MDKEKFGQLQSIIDDLIENEALSRDKKKDLEKKAQDIIGLDDLNMAYFVALYSKFKHPQKTAKPLAIHEEGKGDDKNCTIAYPTAIAGPELMKQLPFVQYADLKEKIDLNYAKNSVLWMKKMQAGTGSSIKRHKYLSKTLGISIDEVKIGAKGTDLYIEQGEGKRFSLVEAQILQAVCDAHEQKYDEIVLHDIISNETEKSIDDIWERPLGTCSIKARNYKQLVEETKGLEVFGKSYQYHIPTIDDLGKISFNRLAPGGHALFGVDAIRAAYIDELRPKTDKVLISSIGNGEDLSSGPDPVMVSWMAKENIPIALVTTTKTNIDLKGGQIAIIPGQNKESTYLTLIEKAQAEAAQQLPLFEQLGLRSSDNDAFFNTNMVLINYNALTPKIKKAIEEIGEEEFMRAVAPDLILNPKEQEDSDGVTREYIQLEGAIGSLALNLDRFWRSRYCEPLVYFLNVDAHERTTFFSPIKTAFDYWMQCHSDRFHFEQSSFRLINNSLGKLPTISLKDSFYKEVQNVLDCFDGCKIIDLDSLEISGIVCLKGITLKGKVTITSKSEKMVDLHKHLKEDETILENVVVEIGEDGNGIKID